MRIAAATGVVVAVAVLAGCGGGGSSSNGVAAKSPAEILAAAKAAATQASAVHIAGSIVGSGGTPLTIDLHLVSTKGGKGHMTESGLGFDIIRIGNKAYVRGSEAFYKQFANAAAAKLLKGKWLVGPTATGNFASLAPLTDLKQFFGGALGRHDKLTKGAETTVNGQKVVALKDGANGGTLYVATTGTPYPIELVSPGNGKTGKITFDQWNTTVTIAAPKGAVDISKLNG